MAINLDSREEFKKLYKDTYGGLVNFAYAKTNDMELSKEIVQNVFVKLWNNRKSIKIKTSVKSYLYSMVRNNIIDYFRKAEKLTDLEDVKKSLKYEFPLNEKEKEEEMYEMLYHLKKAIFNLKEKRREIFELSKFEGLTYKEITNHLDISERVVEDNIAKALKQIKRYFIENKLV